MVERLLEMIKIYQAEVFEAASVFEKYKGLHPSNAGHDGPEAQGYLDPEQTIYYYFHGLGLCVIFPDRRIDWEFDLEGKSDKFDLWRLWIFATEGTNQFPEFEEEETLEKAFNEALERGVIRKCPDDFPEQLYKLS
jgi:hypothetical protein